MYGRRTASKRDWARWAAIGAALLLVTLNGGGIIPTPASAQTRTARASRPRAPRPVRSLVTGTVSSVALDAVHLTTDDNKPVVATLLASTKVSRGREKVGQNFASGDKVVARIATYPDGRVTLVQIWDLDAHQEEQTRRRTVTLGKVVEMRDAGKGSGDLVVETADETHVTFRVTSKTVWFKSNSLTAPSAFPVGATVAVRPRALPSGGIMAGIVADSANMAEQAYHDTLTVWRGKATTTDAAQLYLTLTRDDNATRTVWVPPTLTIGDEKDRRKKTATKRYKLGELTGSFVVVRIDKKATPRPDGKPTVGELTVSSPAPAPAAEPTPKSAETQEKAAAG